MNYTYAASSNTATNGVSLGTAGQDIIVHKILIGKPVANGNITLYNSAVAVGSASTNIAYKLTLPATLAGSSQSYPFETVINFGETVNGSNVNGLPLDGGNLQIDQTMQVTVVWEPAAQS